MILGEGRDDLGRREGRSLEKAGKFLVKAWKIFREVVKYEAIS